MIFKEDKMQYTNVYSKRYLCKYSEMGVCMEDFLQILKVSGAVRKGGLFYSLNQITEDEVIEIEFFQPVKEYCNIQYSGFLFHSYFFLEHMISSVVLRNYDRIEENYAEIMMYIESRGLQEKSNFYAEIHNNGNEKYLILKMAAE